MQEAIILPIASILIMVCSKKRMSSMYVRVPSGALPSNKWLCHRHHKSPTCESANGTPLAVPPVYVIANAETVIRQGNEY